MPQAPIPQTPKPVVVRPATPKTRETPDHDFFVKIINPLGFRKNLLEASKGTLGILKDMYVIKDIREQKQEKKIFVQRELKEVRILVQKLEEMLPRYSKADVQKHFPGMDLEARKKQEKPSPPPVEQKPKQLTDLELLSQSLQDIERKISELHAQETQARR